VRKPNLIDVFALILISVGLALFAYGLSLDPPSSMGELVVGHFGDWSPGFIIDGLLLLIINRVIQINERKRVISQVASLSNDFALDAVRRCRDEGWLQNGVLRNKLFDNARLANADLSGSNLAGARIAFADLSRADLTHANLRGADLRGTTLNGADLRWADLSSACLQWSDLRSALLDGARLGGVTAEFAFIDESQSAIPELGNAVVGGFLTERQIDLVRSGFQQFQAAGESGAMHFYERLFELAPHLRKLFPDDVGEQSRKFLQALKVIVSSLSSTEHTVRMLQRLGDRHKDYGVKTSYYEVVGGALLGTLADELGDEFTDEAREAWTAAFRLISAAMTSTRS
jgi:hemoglobin-like flavoprotein